MTNLVKAGAALLAALMLAGCGGGGERPPIADVTTGGIWTGSVVDGEALVGLVGYVSESGAAHFIREDGVQFWGTLGTSQRELSGTLSGAAPFGATFPDGSAGATASIRGTILPYGTIRGTLRLTTAGGASTSGEVFLEFDTDYGRSVSVENLAGNYTDAQDPGSDSVTISSGGALFGQDPATGCVLNGQVRRINPPYNTYGISVTYDGCTGDHAALNGSTLEGLGILDFDNPALRFVAGLGGTASGVPVAILFAYERT